MLVASNISKAYADRTLFHDLDVSVAAGDRVALIGANGSGKTTLLDILAGETLADAGSISGRRNTTVGYLKQEPPPFAGKSLLQEVLDANYEAKELADMIAKTRHMLSISDDGDEQRELMGRLGDLELRLETAGGEDRDHEAKAILSGLGFKESDFGRDMAEFSGGWIMRAELARLLFRQPDVLLLDEPTNHLDLEANLWFEKYLASFKGGVVITSHDRAFLNQAANRILAIEPGEVVHHRGNYDDYLVARERALEVKEAAAARQEREIQRQMRFVERFRYKATKARQVQSRLKQLDKMEIIELPRATMKVRYSFPEPARSGSDIITLSGVSKSYGDNVVYRDLNLTLERGDRVALVGPNGAGKSTLLKISGRRAAHRRWGAQAGAQRGDHLLRPTRAGSAEPGQHGYRRVAGSRAGGVRAKPEDDAGRIPVQRGRYPETCLGALRRREGAGGAGETAAAAQQFPADG